MSERISLLVVEDDQELAELLQEALREEGYDAQTTRSGAEALAWLERASPALILLDALMPDMTGWEFDERRRAEPRLARIPVVVATGLPRTMLSEHPIDAVATLSKPYRIDDVLAVVALHAVRRAP